MYKKGSTRRTRRFPRIRGTFRVQSGRVKRFSVLASGLGTILTATRYCSVWILFFFFPSFLFSFFLFFFLRFDRSTLVYFLDGSRDRGRRSVDDLGSVQSSPMESWKFWRNLFGEFFDDEILCEEFWYYMGENNARGWIPESFIRLGFENS